VSQSQSRVRLRQAVFVAEQLEPVAAQLREALGLDEPFRDPGVGVFGLANTVFALGDCFLEIVSPVAPDTAAGRYLARHGGDGGYMVMFDLEDLDSARARAEAAGVRTVWSIDLPDISGTHLHPADTRGAIVSIDGSLPYGSWRWGGPGWTAQVGSGAPGALSGVTIAVADPASVASRWGEVLGVAPDGAELKLDSGDVRFIAADTPAEEGLCEIRVDLPEAVRDGRDEIAVAGVRLKLGDAR
jgi:Glyoxalase-like domain